MFAANLQPLSDAPILDNFSDCLMRFKTRLSRIKTTNNGGINMKKRQVIAIALGIVLVFALTLRRTPAAGKPVSANRSADVIFFGNDPSSGSPGYKIVGDGAVSDLSFSLPNTLYASMATINHDLSGDCLLGLKRTTRFLRYDFGDRPPLEDWGPMSVKRIGPMSVGQIKYDGAVEFGTALGQVRFGNVERPESGEADPWDSSSVIIHRLDQNTWDVRTEDCVDDHCTNVRAVLLQTVKGKTEPSTYHMPFHMIIRQK